jgi:hypothetical protein
MQRHVSTPDDLQHLSAALLPVAGLGALADLRCRSDIRVAMDDVLGWVMWPAGDEAVISRLMPVAGVALFHEETGTWFQLGSRLPTADLPRFGPGQPLHDVLVPAPFAATPPDEPTLTPVVFRFVPASTHRPTSALLCSLRELATWADGASSIRLASFTAARLQDQILLRGANLPLLPSGVRLWGQRVLLPLGRRLEPDLGDEAVYDALGVADNEIVYWSDAGPEAIAVEAFTPLLRASLRLAQEEEAAQG